MKVVVIPDVDEILEVLRPYLWAEITDLEVRDMLQALADCGFIVSHEVEVDAEVVVAIERERAVTSNAGKPKVAL